MKKRLQDENIDFLFKAVLSLENIDECYDFFDDLCTIAEIKAMAQRLHVANMLKSQMSYVDIAAKTGASTATISRVNRCLNYGSEGYQTILERIKDDASV